MGLKHVYFLAILAIALFCGCIGQPKPLSETGFFPVGNTNASEIFSQLPENPIGIGGAGAIPDLSSLNSAPMKCTMKGTGGMQDTIIYMKGRNTRSEYYDPQLKTTIVTIMRDNQTYISGGTGVFVGCDWVRMNASQMAKGSANFNLTVNNATGNSSKPELNLTATPDWEALANLTGTNITSLIGMNISGLNGLNISALSEMNLSGMNLTEFEALFANNSGFGQGIQAGLPGSLPKMDCEAGNFTDDIFEAGGIVCNFEDTLSSMLFNGLDCNSLSDATAREECAKYSR